MPKSKKPDLISPEDETLWQQTVGTVKGLSSKMNLSQDFLSQGHVPLAFKVRRHTGTSLIDEGRMVYGTVSRRGIPELCIDLHGLTLSAAHKKVLTFLEKGREAEAREGWIITGKGGPATAGTLRMEVPKWLFLAQEAGLIQTYRVGLPREGGEGALCVLFRRRRQQRP